MRRIELTDPNPPGEQVKLFLARGEGGDWGELEPLRGTSWQHGVVEITAESLSHALHGLLLPLFRELGRDPRASGRRVTGEEGLCQLREGCLEGNVGLCRPGGRKRREHGPPACYEPPLDSGTDPRIQDLFRLVAQAWRDQRHTVVVVGEGFNLR